MFRKSNIVIKNPSSFDCRKLDGFLNYLARVEVWTKSIDSKFSQHQNQVPASWQGHRLAG